MTYQQYATWRDDPVSLEPSLSVVIPAYNEATRIVPTVAAIAAHLSQREQEFEIIVSDDGSTDATVALVRGLGLRNVVVLDPGVNRGKGAAVRAGVAAAVGDLVLFSDADLSTPIEELDRMLETAGHADVVIGSRAVEGASEAEKSGVRRVLSSGVRRLVRAALGLDVADSQCGFKLFRRDAARNLFAAQTIQGFSFDAEILYLAKRLGYRVAELPVRWVDAPGSTVRPLSTSVRFLRDLGRIRYRSLRGRYPAQPAPTGTDPLAPGLRLAVVTALPPSQATLTEYGRHLVDRLDDVDEVREVLVFAEDSNGIPESTDTVTVEAGWRFDSITSPLRIARLARKHQPDAVIFNTHFTSFGGRKIPAALGLCTPALMRLMGHPTTVLLHNLVDTVDLDAAGFGTNKLVNRIMAAIGRLLTRVLLRADRVVTTMPTYVDILRDRYGADNVALTPHGSFDTPPPPRERADDTPRILAFGKFGTYKRVDDLVEAFRLLKQRPGLGDVELIIAGTDSPNAPGYLAGVAAAAADVPDISFTGYVAEDDVADLFENAAVVVFPYTATTGSSGPLHQAGAYGRAVVAPRLGDFIDLMEEEGFRAEGFDPDDVQSLTDAIARVLTAPELRAEMGRANHAAAIGLPLADIAEWHVAHVEDLLTAA